ncbi:CDP-alcohol phosphatidyltransferase family protein [Synechococcus sp. UW140]|uniref:CDP-alcohol phosphatidyltransferase family protein n=1 Tax=Synechococcus sp. UW140 TaxID=368503 RepID=UPI001FCB7F62|nr:CDP-alcohol phosphatidyltransferase family protein [Synechococcus sp. UW140]
MESRWRTWADRLTVFRAVAGLPLLMALIAQQQALAWSLLLLAGISDALDGWMARRAGGGSSWGARLDPLADKLLLAAPLIWLATHQTLPLWAVWLLLAREMLISGWRRDADDGAPASRWGKAKTVLQFTSLLLLLWPETWGPEPLILSLQQLGWWLFWPSLLLALHSAVGYLKPGRSRPHHH